MFNRITISTLVSVLVLLCACTSNTKQQPTLTVSIEPQRYLLEQIAGEKWQVNTMLADGANPETFDPPMSALKSATTSAAYFKIGTIAFEDVLVKKVGGKTMIVDTSNGISLLHGTHSCGNHTHQHVDDTDPHIWSSVCNAKIMARNMCYALSTLDAGNADTYKKNYDQLILKLDSLDQNIHKILSDKKGETFITWHPSLSYFARDYSLNQLAIGSESKEMSIDAFRAKIDEITSLGAKVMLLQPEMDNNRTAEIAHQTGVKTITINLLSYNWPEEMIKVAKSI